MTQWAHRYPVGVARVVGDRNQLIKGKERAPPGLTAGGGPQNRWPHDYTRCNGAACIALKWKIFLFGDPPWLIIYHRMTATNWWRDVPCLFEQNNVIRQHSVRYYILLYGCRCRLYTKLDYLHATDINPTRPAAADPTTEPSGQYRLVA